jgi:hypothetical protein
MDVEEIESRVERLNRMISESRIIRNVWFGIDQQGRETACLLAALSPEAGESENPDFCPAAVMPQWLAHLTPWLDDACTSAAWPSVVRRYAACAARWHTLDEAAWRRVEVVARRAAVVEAMRHTSDEQVLDACRDVLDWLDSDMPESSRAAERAAAAAAWAAEVAAEGAAWAASAARTAASAARAARAAAAWASEAAERAAVAAASAAASASEAWAAAEAADRIVDAILAALEQECLAVR